MAQFRVEFILDTASGMYLVELYHPEIEDEIVVRTEPIYPSQAAAVLGMVQLFKDAMLEVPGEERPTEQITARKPRKAPGKKAAKKKSAGKKAKKAKKAKKKRRR